MQESTAMRQLLTPRLPRLRYDRILWVLGAFLLFVFLMSAISRKKNSQLDRIMISVQPLKSGASMLTEQNVRRTIQKGITERLEGAYLEEVDCNRVEAFLETDPFIADANVYLDINNRIRVDVEQREPTLRIMDQQGGNYYLDQKGAKIPVSRNYTARVMVCTGNIPVYSTDFQEKKQSLLSDLMLLNKKLADDAVFADFFQQIHVTNKDEFILTPLVGDQTIMLGSLTNLEDKLERLKVFYKEGMPRTGWQAYSRLDLRYKDQVVAVKG
jgi:cell division protein FtsQ